jgi:hypothetical protein
MSKFLEMYESTVKSRIKGEVEKKGQFDYLSWAYAVKHLKVNYPEAITEQVYYPDSNGNLVLPYLKSETGFYVSCKIYLTKSDFKDGVYQGFNHPVLDNRNRPLAKPDSFHINTSYMRCLTKGIAITTGIGLSLYAGEDLPPEPKETINETVSKAFAKCKSKEELEKKYDEITSYYKSKNQDVENKGWFINLYKEFTDKL